VDQPVVETEVRPLAAQLTYRILTLLLLFVARLSSWPTPDSCTCQCDPSLIWTLASNRSTHHLAELDKVVGWDNGEEQYLRVKVGRPGSNVRYRLGKDRNEGAYPSRRFIYSQGGRDPEVA
jgi:hypothetical protein